MTLRDDERERYGRHLVIPDIGEEGQEKLKHAGVLVVGTGGLGSPALFYLAAAGVGRLGLVDSDVVELSNLQRQILHATDDLGRLKTESGAQTLRALNPVVVVERHQVRFDAANATELVRAYDVVIDAVDNFESRFLLNDVCVLERKTLVEAGILRFTGLAITIRGGETACYRCLFPREPRPGEAPTTAEAGVFGGKGRLDLRAIGDALAVGGRCWQQSARPVWGCRRTGDAGSRRVRTAGQATACAQSINGGCRSSVSGEVRDVRLSSHSA